MKKTPILLLAVASLMITMACVTFERIIFGAPEPAPVTQAAPTPEPPTPQPEATETPISLPTESASCPNGDCITACVADLGSIINRSATNTLRQKFNAASQDEEITLATYTISGDQIIDPVFEENIPQKLKKMRDNTSAHQNIWRYFAALIPNDQRTILEQFVISTDGQDEILASVYQSDESPEKWNLQVDIADSDNPQDLTFTLIHEFAHLLTLNPDQIEPNLAIFNAPDDPDVYYEESLSSDTYFTYEGCTLPGAYLNLFVEQYWIDLYNEWLEIDSIEDEDEYYVQLDEFYARYHDQFVSDYAVTSPEEDIAESFAIFILEERPTVQDTASQKVRFFYQFPELVKLRRQIALGLCSQAK